MTPQADAAPPDYNKVRANRLETSRELRKAKLRLAGLEKRLSREQQPAQEVKTGPSKRAKQRVRLAELRTEVELLQLEHEAAKAQLHELMKKAKQAEVQSVLGPMAETGRVPVPETMQGLFLLEGMAKSGNREAFELVAALEDDGSEESRKGIDKLLKAFESAEQKNLARRARQQDDWKVLLDQKKKSFARQATALNQQRLELLETAQELKLEVE